MHHETHRKGVDSSRTPAVYALVIVTTNQDLARVLLFVSFCGCSCSSRPHNSGTRLHLLPPRGVAVVLPRPATTNREVSALGQQTQQHELRLGEILELVHQDVLEEWASERPAESKRDNGRNAVPASTSPSCAGVTHTQSVLAYAS